VPAAAVITQARKQVLRHVDVVQVQTYWQIGRHIVEFEQGGQARAAYGKRLLPQLGQALSREFGKGFDASNLRYMRLFYQAFPNCDALRHELSWTHYRLLLRVDAEPISIARPAISGVQVRLADLSAAFADALQFGPERRLEDMRSGRCGHFFWLPRKVTAWPRRAAASRENVRSLAGCEITVAFAFVAIRKHDAL
jgi:DUF1016 N-terminal domain